MLGVWASGALISLVVAVRRVRRFTRLLGFASPAPAAVVEEVARAAALMGVKRAPRVRIVPGGIAPLLWAVGRPTLYFPAGLLDRLSAAQRFTVVAHELAHLRRRDHIVRLLEFVALAVYWWCPLAWLARRELRRLEEEACDADVVAAAPASGYDYAAAILETIDYLAGVAPAPALASGIGDAASLRRRLVLILNPDRPARPARGARRVVVIAGLALLAVGPKFDRLAASAGAELECETVSAPEPGVPVTFDEVLAEPVQFLPAPVRLIPQDALGGGDSPSLSSALSPDGSRLALAVGRDVIVWDLRVKRVLFSLTGHTDVVNAVSFSPDGTRIATASNDTSAAVWDAVGGQRLHVFAGHGRWVLAATFSPDGRTLATAGYDKTVRLWEVERGTPKGVWTGHSGGVRSVRFSPDGRFVVSGGADFEVRIWDAGRGVTTRTLKGHSAAVRAVAVSPDGSRVASGAEDRTVRVWDVEGREVCSPVPLPDDVTALAFSRCGRALFAGTLGGHLIHIDPSNGQTRGYVGVEAGRPAGSPAHAAAVTAILAPPDGKSLYTVSHDSIALAWPAAGALQAARQVFRGARSMTAVTLSPDGRTLATGGQDGLIRLWDAVSARELAAFPGHPGGVSALVFGTGGRLVSAGADERVRVWDTAAGVATAVVLQPTADLRIALSQDGRTLAIGGRKLPGVWLLNPATSGKPRRFGEWAGEVTALAFLPHGDRVATGHPDGMVRIWDTATGEEVMRGRAGIGSVDAVTFAPTGHTVAVVVNAAPRAVRETESGPTHQVVFLDARDGSVLDDPQPLAHPSPVTAAAFTTDGGMLTAAHDGNLYLWNLGTGRVVRTVRGHVDAVRGIALAADGTAVFSAGDRSAKRWPMGAGTESKKK